jgi:hypothetical protein
MDILNNDKIRNTYNYLATIENILNHCCPTKITEIHYKAI